MWRNIASNSLTIIVVLLFLLSGLVVLAKSKYSSAGPLDRAICLQVEPGSSMSKVVDRLDAQGALSNKSLFWIGIDYTNKSNNLKAGSYLIPARASMVDIAEQITTSGRSTCGTEIIFRVGIALSTVLVRDLDPTTKQYVEVARFQLSIDPKPDVYDTKIEAQDTRIRLVIAEGTTSWRIVEALKSIDILKDEINSIPSEGSLAPGSYDIKRGDSRKSVASAIEQAQSEFLAQVWSERTAITPVGSEEELLILASIIEKETGLGSERSQVASVFANRLRKDMALQTDPAVIYGITQGKILLGRGLLKSELKKDTPWNTYLNKGLPLTPISNPGRDSLRAALTPDTTKYIFFVADGKGGHAFSETYAEHQKNVKVWRAIEASK